MTTLMDKEKTVFERLQDDESKEIFLWRKKWSEKNLVRVDNLEPFGYKSSFIKELDNILKKEKFILYGFGGAGKSLYQYFKAMNTDCESTGTCVQIWDNYVQKKGGLFAPLRRKKRFQRTSIVSSSRRQRMRNIMKCKISVLTWVLREKRYSC